MRMSKAGPELAQPPHNRPERISGVKKPMELARQRGRAAQAHPPRKCMSRRTRAVGPAVVFDWCALLGRIFPDFSGGHIPHHPPMHVRQPEVPATGAVGQPLVIHAPQGENGCVRVVNVDSLHGRLAAALGRPLNPLPWRIYARARMIVPLTIRPPPIHCCHVRRSPRNRTARAMATTTLNLSTGATRDASPSCKARK